MDAFPAQLGGLPSPVDLLPSNKVVVIRNGVADIVDVAAVKAESGGGLIAAAGFDGHHEKDAIGSVTATTKG